MPEPGETVADLGQGVTGLAARGDPVRHHRPVTPDDDDQHDVIDEGDQLEDRIMRVRVEAEDQSRLGPGVAEDGDHDETAHP